jgi:hypothetical protein
MSACDVLREMKNEISKYSSVSEAANHAESWEIRFAKLERRVRSAEQPGMWQNLYAFVFL